PARAVLARKNAAKSYVPKAPPSRARTPSSSRIGRGNAIPARPARSDFAEAVTDAVKRLDHVEVLVDGLELLAQALDVAVDRAVVDIDLLVISRIHKRVPALDHAWPLGERMQDEELRHRQRDWVTLPSAGMTLLVHDELAAFQRTRLLALCLARGFAGASAPQDRAHAFDKKPLRERFAHEIVGAH